MHIDWAKLSDVLDCGSSGGTHLARRALAEILGEEAIKEAVDYYIAGRAGSELARSVLWQLRPQAGMNYCYQIFKEATDAERRCSAVELLRVVADETALKWVPEFLNDPDEGIQIWGAGVVDQLLWSRLIDEEDCQVILSAMARHPNAQVRERVEFISKFLEDRNSDCASARGPEASDDG